jgi:hypothetical protein
MDEAQTGIVHDAQVHHARRHVVSVQDREPDDGGGAQPASNHTTSVPTGVVCPIESPDNKDIRLTKHFAVMAHVTVYGLSAESVKRALLDLGATSSACAAGVPVWLNGTPSVAPRTR